MGHNRKNRERTVDRDVITTGNYLELKEDDMMNIYNIFQQYDAPALTQKHACCSAVYNALTS